MGYQIKGNTDKNQPEIVKNLKKLGISVYVDVDDILVGYKGRNYWFEIKNESQRSKKTGKVLQSALSKKQKKLLKEWKGQIDVVFTLQEILDVIKWKNGKLKKLNGM